MAVPKSYLEFMKTVNHTKPPSEWPDGLKALWYDAKSDWDASHDIAQEMHSELGSWIHAYLHRREGDDFNAGYWYRKAKRDFPKMTLEEEHRKITEFTLSY